MHGSSPRTSASWRGIEATSPGRSSTSLPSSMRTRIRRVAAAPVECAHGRTLPAGDQRSMPQTFSATSAVNASRRSNAAGTPREVSENAIVPASMRAR